MAGLIPPHLCHEALAVRLVALFEDVLSIAELASPFEEFLGVVGEAVERFRKASGKIRVITKSGLHALDQDLSQQDARTVVRVFQALRPDELVDHVRQKAESPCVVLAKPGKDET